jgi:hypothetical protein
MFIRGAPVTLLLFWIVMAIICAMIAGSKGRSAFGFFFYGLLIWPIALVHILISARRPPEPAKGRGSKPKLSKDGRKPCPFCAESILPAARVCPHCREKLRQDWSK